MPTQGHKFLANCNGHLLVTRQKIDNINQGRRNHGFHVINVHDRHFVVNVDNVNRADLASRHLEPIEQREVPVMTDANPRTSVSSQL